jgi:pimeloyl-ACP methyl ester carboxylesterase
LKTVGIIAAGLLGIALLAIALLFLFQRRLIYPAPAQATRIAAPGFERVALRTDDGLLLTALYRLAKPGFPTIIFFHGNADSLSGSLVATEGLARAGYGLLLPEYRGYGGNPGSPDEAGLNRDAAAAAAFLRHRGIPDGATFAYGNSLGSGPATHLATTRPLAGLVLVSGYTSLPDAVADSLAPWPVRALVRDRFDNLGKLRGSAVPVLVVHGDADRVIPVAQGRRLGAARAAIAYREVPGVGHDLAYRPATQGIIVTWLGSHPAGR